MTESACSLGGSFPPTWNSVVSKRSTHRGPGISVCPHVPLHKISFKCQMEKSVGHSVVSDSWRPHGLVRWVPLFVGFSRQEDWSGVPVSSLGDLPHPGIKPRSPALQVDFLPSEPQGSPQLKKLSPKKADWALCPSPEGAGVTLSVEGRPGPCEGPSPRPLGAHPAPSFLAPHVRVCVLFLPRPARSDPQASDLHRHCPLPLAPGGVSIPGERAKLSRRWEGEPNPAANYNQKAI